MEGLLLSSCDLYIFRDPKSEMSTIHVRLVSFLRSEVFLVTWGVDSWRLDLVYPQLCTLLGFDGLVNVRTYGLELLASRAVSIGIVFISK